jgi:DNA-binding response OmpR family regulator
LTTWVVNRAKGSVRGCCGTLSPKAEKRGILLISDDASLGQKLKSAAVRTGRGVVQVDGVADALREVLAGQAGVVLLDLDLPSQAAWEAADCLLQEESCPPLILLTASSDQFDLNTAIRAGSLVDKNTDPSRLLEAVDRTLVVHYSAQAERNAIQRVMIGWLKPCGWSVPVEPAHRFLGINE